MTLLTTRPMPTTEPERSWMRVALGLDRWGGAESHENALTYGYRCLQYLVHTDAIAPLSDNDLELALHASQVAIANPTMLESARESLTELRRTIHVVQKLRRQLASDETIPPATATHAPTTATPTAPAILPTAPTRPTPPNAYVPVPRVQKVEVDF